MSELNKEILPITIEHELKSSYLDYAMSVIVGRALPDVRDGLKPVHRRTLFAMHELGNDWNKPYKKSARIVGDVIGKYHPHGDSAVYDTIVRMAQPFSMRYLLVDGQGNFGSVDGDAAAAMRYTEVRMSRFAHSLLADLDKETVDFVDNYDGSERIPAVMPTRVPHLLVNGTSGIAVGMATNIPPHNLGEVIDATVALLLNPDLSIDDLMTFIPGPDFPTAGIINGRAGIVAAYRTGRGRIYVRAKTHIETDERSSKESIIITELPYQVNKAKLIEKIADLVREKKIEGITALRDESDKDGMRVVIELRRGEMSEILLNQLYTHTAMQSVFGINMVALHDERPRTLTLKEILEAFIKHRREVVTRRILFELRKAKERAHILEGLGVALANIEEMIALIKASKTGLEAKEALLARTWEPGWVKQLLSASDVNVTRPEDCALHEGLHGDTYQLTPTQVQAILDLRLQRLTGLEQNKIHDDYQELVKVIIDLMDILSSPERLKQVIKDELLAAKGDFADARRTEIIGTQEDITVEDLITEEDVAVTLSHEGYVKVQSLDNYRLQRRGGRGKAATKMKEEDFIEKLLIANTHDTLLCFSSRGKVYWLKTYQLPAAQRTSRGKPIVNLLPLESGERIQAILPVKDFTADVAVIMATRDGLIKKIHVEQFARPRNSGIIALDLLEGDSLVNAELVNANQEVMLFSDDGKAIRFNSDEVRLMGRNARGVMGIRLKENAKVIALLSLKEGGAILTATEGGYGKRSALEEYRATGRHGSGVISIIVNERNGKVVGACQVFPGDEVMLISDQATLVRTSVDEISHVGRNAQGVILIRLEENEHLIAVQSIADVGDDSDSGVEEAE
ncbi:MAG: gyrA [Gammaproteobacteria bacterium]|jgi:DNA gyrase subunit A|nr:gyrA [Gammaproteobacteria bacterium]